VGTLQIPVEQRFVMTNVDWDTYLTFSDKIGDRNIRFNYNGVDLELVTLSHEHEKTKKWLARLVEALTEEMDIDILCGGSMTCRREDLERGFEPDECFWIAHEAQVRGRDDIDLTRDPPPDLVLEVEISRSFLDRLNICARLGVPEVWRWDGQTLRVVVLGSDGEYVASERSPALPFLRVADLVPFLRPDPTQSETKLLRTFRVWVRGQIARGWADATP